MRYIYFSLICLVIYGDVHAMIGPSIGAPGGSIASRQPAGIGGQAPIQHGAGGATIGGKSKVKPVVSPIIFLWRSRYFQQAEKAYNSAIRLTGEGFAQIGGVKITYRPIDQAAISAYQSAISAFAKAYTDPAITMNGSVPHFVIDGTVSNNYVISVIKRTMSLFLHNLQALKNTIIYFKSVGKDYTGLANQLSVQAKRYDTAVLRAKPYVAKNWDALYQPYGSSTKGLLVATYTLALSDLAERPQSAASASVVAQAQLYFQQAQSAWREDLVISGFANAQQALQSFHLSMAQIAYNAYQNQLAAMRPEDLLIALADMVGSRSHNRLFLEKACTYVKLAADAYKGMTGGDFEALQARFQGFYRSLDEAIKLLDAALASGGLDAQVAALGQAIAPLQAGGASWLAQHIQQASALLLADSYFAQAGTKLKNFVGAYQKRFAQAASFIQTTDLKNKDTFQDVFGSLADACRAAGALYDRANVQYQIASQTGSTLYSNGPLLTSMQTQYIGNQLTLMTGKTIFDNCGSAGSLLAQAMKLLGGERNALVVAQVQKLAASALSLLATSDSSYQSLIRIAGAKRVHVFVPFYTFLPSSSFATFIGGFLAHRYRVLAASVVVAAGTGDAHQVLLADYYLAAFSYQQYLSADVRQDIMRSLRRVTAIVQSARQALAAAQSADEQAKSNKSDVNASLVALWESALSATLAVYTIWHAGGQSVLFKDGPTLYRDCLLGYVQSYAMGPEADAWLRVVAQYRLYLLDAVGGVSVPHVSELLLKMQHWLEKFVEQARILAGQAAALHLDPKQGYAEVLQAVRSLQLWQERADSLVARVSLALSDQKDALMQAVPDLKALFVKAQGSGNVIYSSPLFSNIRALPLGSLMLQLAQLSQKQGDWAVERATALVGAAQVPLQAAECTLSTGYRGIAAGAYAQAGTAYNNIGNVQLGHEMALLSQIEGALALADMVADAAKVGLPNTTRFSSFLGGLPVYGQYFLSPWLVQLPQKPALTPAALFSDYAAYSKNKNDASLRVSLEEDLRIVAAAAYLYQHLMAAGLVGSFTHDYVASVVGSEAVADPAFVPYVQAAQSYRTHLADLMAHGTKLDGLAIKTTLTFLAPAGRLPALVYCNIPVFPVPMGQKSEQVDPTAVLAYAFALNQYQSFKTASSSQQKYAQERVNALQRNIQQAYLSQVYAFFEKIAYMRGGVVSKDLLKLITVDEQERAQLVAQRAFFQHVPDIDNLDHAQAKQLVSAVSWVQDYFALAATYVATAASPSALTGLGLPEAQGLLGFCYEQHADFVASFLMGDPRAVQYQNYLTLASKLYVFAEGAYQQAHVSGLAVRTKRGQMFENVARAYYSKQHYIASLSYFNTAQGLYQSLGSDYQQVDAEQAALYEQKATRMGLEGLEALFYGAIEYFVGWYKSRWSTPLILSSGGSVSSFDQLMADCSIVFGFREDEKDECKKLRESILDALVYLTSVDTTIAEQAQRGGVVLVNPSASAMGALSTGAQNAQAKVQQDSVVQAYLAKRLPIDPATKKAQDLATVFITGSLSAEKVRSILRDFLFGGAITPEQVGHLAGAKAALAGALSTTKEWADYIFQAISACFIHTYLASVCAEGVTSQCIVDQYSSLIDAMKTEEQNIIAPAQEWVG